MLLPFALAAAVAYGAYHWYTEKSSPRPKAMVGADVDGPAFESYPPGCTGVPKVTVKAYGKRLFRCSVYRCAGVAYSYYAVCQENGTSNWVSFLGYPNGRRIFYRADAPNRQTCNALCVALGVEQ